ncbi:GNAT family N-acetyltransferase [Rhodobacteraceae bacterium M385]|nr:GNAT family N-acetyltransferase [Rhodobacteraceae bacterium M385]
MDVSIQPLKVSDINDEFVSWHQNTDGHLDYYTGSQRSISKDDLIAWVSTAKSKNTFFYMIMVDGTNPVGTVKIGPVDTKNKTSDLVCLIGSRSYLGKGLASRAITIANNEAFENHDIRRLHGGMYEDNIASIKAYCRAGWVIEGRMSGFYWVDAKPMDRVCVACFNPKYFPSKADHENQ